MQLSFPAAVAATKVFQMYGTGVVVFDISSTNWATATFTLTVDTNGLGTYHTYHPPTSAALMLDGNDFVISAENWNGGVLLGPGHYGITITNAPTAPVLVNIAHELLGPDTNTSTYGG